MTITTGSMPKPAWFLKNENFFFADLEKRRQIYYFSTINKPLKSWIYEIFQNIIFDRKLL